jgi:uncharacterized protein
MGRGDRQSLRGHRLCRSTAARVCQSVRQARCQQRRAFGRWAYALIHVPLTATSSQLPGALVTRFYHLLLTSVLPFGNIRNGKAEGMRIGVISDTHGNIENTLAAVRMLKSLEVEAVLHAGDIGSPQIPKLLAEWPAHFVFGNCDPDGNQLRAAIEQAGLTCHGRFGDFTLSGRRIALIHSDDARLFHRVCTSGDYDLVCYGHTHAAEQHREGRTLILNPGALYRANPHTIATVELETMEALIIRL